MLQFKIGDKVKISSELSMMGEHGDFDNGVGYISDMAEYAGQTVTINGILESRDCYRILEDCGNYLWSEDMFDIGKEIKIVPMQKVVEHTAVNQIDREQLLKEMYDTLEICQIYHPTDEGMNAIIDEWSEQKGCADVWEGNSVLDILSYHPDYVPEKGYIVKKNEYDRGVDISVITDVFANLDYTLMYPENNGIIKEVDIRPWSYAECMQYKVKLNRILDALGTEDGITWRGMSYEQVRHERNEWVKRLAILEDEYRIINDKCYSPDDANLIEKLRYLIDQIKHWAVTKAEKMTEDELLQPLLIDEHVVNCITNFEEQSGKTIRGIRVGQKFNKVINKILTETGVKDTWENYNKQIARLSDASSPTKFTRFTIISANPVDFWRMSFGSSWKSCHTIDKEGYYSPSDGGDGYEGMHASGTESYMLDPSSVVMYTVDKAYEDSDYELEPKINRCMFHLGEGKFVMGRVYPQGTDGEAEVYRQWRQIFQQIIAECMGVPNYWKTEKDRQEKIQQIRSRGTHYRDYEMSYCDIAGWSYLKPDADAKPSERKITIGATPICPCCGETHYVEDNIECERCNEEGVCCARCGWQSSPENMHEIDGDYYCEDCCFWCEYHEEWEIGDHIYVENYGDVCEDSVYFSDDFARCSHCGEYYYIGNGSGIDTENGEWFCCEGCAEDAGYVQARDGLWYPGDDLYYCEECDEYVTDSEWNEDMNMCNHCAEQREEEIA